MIAVIFLASSCGSESGKARSIAQVLLLLLDPP
jgi:hypothetical protein